MAHMGSLHLDTHTEEELAQISAKNKLEEYGIEAVDVDWSWASQPVTQQGSCGSCWAFSGNTVLEATEKITNPDQDAGKIALSHQLPVDCAYWGPPDYLGGCDGGDGNRMFGFYKREGTTSADSYMYTSGESGQTGS